MVGALGGAGWMVRLAHQSLVETQAEVPPRPEVTGPPLAGRYEILGRLGSGAMATVFLARDPSLQRDVAIKVMKPTLDGRPDPAGAVRLHREAQSMAQVTHPNIVEVLDVGHVGDSVFIAMEYVAGGTLAGWLEDPRTWAEVVAVFIAVGGAMQAIHEAGLLHGDFKLDNVLVRGDGQPMVTDFGLARFADGTEMSTDGASADAARAMRSGAKLEATGTTLGTPMYMAPEQHLGEPVDGRAEQYAFCVALYYALYGRFPFEGDTLPEIVASVTSDEGPVLPWSAVPGRLSRIVLRGLSRSPGARFPDFRTLVRSLHQCRPSERRQRVAGGLCAAAVVTLIAYATATEAEPPSTPIETALAGVRDEVGGAEDALSHRLDRVRDLTRRGQHEQALGVANEVQAVAEARADWASAVRAIELRMWIIGIQQAHPKQALPLAEVGQRHLERAEIRDEIRRDFWRRWADVLDASGKHELALERYNRALSLAQEGTVEAVEIEVEIASMKLNLGRPVEALAQLRAALDRAEALPSYPNLAALLLSLANSENANRETDLAVEHIERARALYVREYGVAARQLAYCDYTRSMLEVNAGRPATARKFARRAVQEALEVGDARLAAGAAHMLAQISFVDGDVASLRETLTRVLVFAQAELAENDSLFSRLHLDVGLLAVEEGRLQEAGRSLARAESLCDGGRADPSCDDEIEVLRRAVGPDRQRAQRR